MTTHAVKLEVIAGVPEDCSFWLEDDGWNGVCEDLSVKVRGNSFEDAKTKMEAALQTHIESVLRKHSTARELTGVDLSAHKRDCLIVHKPTNNRNYVGVWPQAQP